MFAHFATICLLQFTCFNVVRSVDSRVLSGTVGHYLVIVLDNGQCILQCHTNNIWNISELNKQTEINNSLFCLIGCCFFYCRRNLMIWNRLNSLLYSVDFLCKKNGSRGPWVFLYCKLLPLLP